MKLLFLLVLFFLVLNSASHSAQEPRGEIPNEQKIPSAKPKHAGQDQRPAEAQRAFEKSLTESLRTLADQQKADYEQRRADQKPWWIDPALLSVGLVYTVFAGLQWWEIRRQAAVAVAGIEVARDAAKAAGESAKAVDAQLHVYRPFLVVIRPEVESRIMNVNQGAIPRSAVIKVRNDGLGPADIVGYEACCKVFAWSSIDDDPRASDIFPNQPGSKIIGSVVAADKTVELPNMDIDIKPAELDSINQRKSLLAIYGIFHYRGGPEKIYWTRFFYWHRFEDVPPVTEIASSQELNAHS